MIQCTQNNSCQRKDNLHRLSTRIANQYDIVCVETLDMQAMANKGFGNGKATLDNGYGMFLMTLEYKQADRGHHGKTVLRSVIITVVVEARSHDFYKSR